jgi:hypothetical protein
MQNRANIIWVRFAEYVCLRPLPPLANNAIYSPLSKNWPDYTNPIPPCLPKNIITRYANEIHFLP